MPPHSTESTRQTTVLHFEKALLPAGWARNVRIALDGSRIARIEADTPKTAASHCYKIGLPGMANLHSHAFQRGFAGLSERRSKAGQDSFWTWREVMYGFVARITPDDLEQIAAQAYVEMLEAGFTHVGEFHYLHHAPDGHAYGNIAETAERIGAAASLTGLGLTLLPVFYAHGGFGGAPPSLLQNRFVSGLDQYHRLLDAAAHMVDGLQGGRMGVAPHSLRAVNPQQLSALAGMAGENPIHIHVAEQQREVDDCVAWSGSRPVRWLLDNAPVDRRWCLVHATHIDQSERLAVARSGATVGLCPITEANLGDGLFPLSNFASEGGTFGIGSDSNVLISMTEELRLLEYGQRLRDRSRNVLLEDARFGQADASTGRRLFDAALRGGGQALGIDCGLAAGASADIVTLDADAPSIMDRDGDSVLDGLIFASARPVICDVWRAGRRVVTEGRHGHRDEIASRYRTTLKRLCSSYTNPG